MNIGKVKPTEITQEMEKSYLDYAMSVIVSRALPDVRDGLKPVHRRILYAMQQMGLTSTGKFTKSAKVVGEVLGKYHPHGDVPVYEALVRMAQDFSLRYPLVSGQGNFGSIDGDPPAAMRYTEVKLAPISQELLTDLGKETVDFTENFDTTLKEPLYLPAKLPNLLLMGAEGIAVGMATKIPPHSLGEVVAAIVYMLDHGKAVERQQNQGQEAKTEELPDILRKPSLDFSPTSFDFESDITTENLLKFIKGPDFPTGGAIYDEEEIKNTYTCGRGKIPVRGIAQIEEDKNGKFNIIISEIPYQVNKAGLVAKIAELVREKKINGVTDLRDESDQRGIRVVVELKRAAKPHAILNNLYKYTDLQTTFPANFVTLVEGTPQTLNLKTILLEYIRHRQKVVIRRSVFELREAKHRAHILEGFKIALDHLDEVITTIKRSRDTETAKKNLMTKFDLSDIQAQSILDMPLKRLSRLERQKIDDEYQMVGEAIRHLTDLLSHPQKVLKVIKKELLALSEKYADPRRTRVYKQKLGEFEREDLIPKEEVLLTITHDGYIKRLPIGTYRSQRRGGKGVIGMTTKEEDEIAHLLSASTHDEVLFFTNLGRVFSQKVFEVPEGSRKSRGQAVVNLINLSGEENVTAVLPISGLTKNKYFLMATLGGTVKKTKISEFANIRSSGLIALKLASGDKLCWVKPTGGEDLVLLATRGGKSIRFKEKDIRPMGRSAQGVRGIRLKRGDFVIGMEVFPAKPTKPKDKRRKFFQDLLVICENGLGKRTPIKNFPLQKRGGLGVKVANITKKTGKVATFQLVTAKDKQVVITSRAAQVIKLPLKNIPELGRNTQGVILMRFSDPNDKVAAVTCLRK
jgi:DNA gyrase subunit A